MVTIDERDQAQMGEMSDEDEGPREVEVSVGRQVSTDVDDADYR
jgi:hypothetical protein